MRMLPGFSWIAIFVLGLTVSCSTVAFSASSGDAPAPSTSKPSVSPKKLKCKKGEVVRRVTVKGVKKQKCVKATAGLLPDTDMFEQGNALALDGEYEWALDVLELVGNQHDPDVLNMQGYSHRKAGRLDVAITFYRKALALRPDFVRAREYLGEGYVAAGRTDLAQLELAEIKLRCGTSCHEYQALAKAIATGSN